MQFKEFNELAAVRKLSELAKHPYDLTAPGALSAKRMQGYKASVGGFDYLYAAQRVDDKVLDALQALADEAGLVDKFIAMKNGETMNRIEGLESENRRVLHTAVRDILSNSPFNLEATSQAKKQLSALRQFLLDLDQGEIVNHKGEAFTNIVQVGIGGSDLGPRALAMALRKFHIPGKTAGFISNVDPDDAARVLGNIDLSRTLFNVVSKSGTTLETQANEELVRRALERASLDPRHHILTVTDAGSPMDDPGRYLKSFHMFDYIGGRYSATSMVGGVTLSFVLGYDVFVDILQSAYTVDVAAEERDIGKNVPLLAAMIGIWNRNFLGYGTLAILPYSQALEKFPAHLQQCDMESNGKSVSRAGKRVAWQTGPIVWGEPGTNGQHAFYQLLHQGTEVVPAELIGFRHSQYNRDLSVNGTSSQEKLIANMFAQSLALARGKKQQNPNKSFDGNRPNSILICDRLIPAAMGELLALYENKIVFQGFCWNINSFDQEGVQLGKVLANKLLEDMSAKNKNRLFDIDKATTEYAYLKAADCI